MIFFWGKLIEEEMVRITTQRRLESWECRRGKQVVQGSHSGLTMQVDNETPAYD